MMGYSLETLFFRLILEEIISLNPFLLAWEGTYSRSVKIYYKK
jgi:hypothetical protein